MAAVPLAVIPPASPASTVSPTSTASASTFVDVDLTVASKISEFAKFSLNGYLQDQAKNASIHSRHRFYKVLCPLFAIGGIATAIAGTVFADEDKEKYALCGAGGIIFILSSIKGISSCRYKTEIPEDDIQSNIAFYQRFHNADFMLLVAKEYALAREAHDVNGASEKLEVTDFICNRPKIQALWERFCKHHTPTAAAAAADVVITVKVDSKEHTPAAATADAVITVEMDPNQAQIKTLQETINGLEEQQEEHQAKDHLCTDDCVPEKERIEKGLYAATEEQNRVVEIYLSNNFEPAVIKHLQVQLPELQKRLKDPAYAQDLTATQRKIRVFSLLATPVVRQQCVEDFKKDYRLVGKKFGHGIEEFLDNPQEIEELYKRYMHKRNSSIGTATVREPQ